VRDDLHEAAAQPPAQSSDVGTTRAACPKPKSMSELKEANDVTVSTGLPSPTVAVSTCFTGFCSSTKSTSSWKCSSVAVDLIESRTMDATSVSGRRWAACSCRT
jgi:hypothetical protein